jgi:hypothetical protein
VSEFIRRSMGIIPPRQEVAGATLKELARLCHEAEDTADDLLLVEVSAEVEVREHKLPGATRIFMEWYRLLWAERTKNAKRRDGGS